MPVEPESKGGIIGYTKLIAKASPRNLITGCGAVGRIITHHPRKVNNSCQGRQPIDAADEIAAIARRFAATQRLVCSCVREAGAFVSGGKLSVKNGICIAVIFVQIAVARMAR